MSCSIKIEDGFQIVMIFLEPFFLKFVKPAMIEKGLFGIEKLISKDLQTATESEKERDSIRDDNHFFFIVVCDGSSSDKYFEAAIEQRMGVCPKEQHRGLYVDISILFNLSIDFCEFYNQRFLDEGKDSLRFAIEWLKDMNANPEAHNAEWELWDQVVVDVTKKGQKSMGFF